MSSFSRSELRSLWPVAGTGGALGLFHLGEAIVLGLGVVPLPDGYLLGALSSLVFVVGLLYGSYWIATSELPGERYARINRWFAGGLLVFLLLNVGFMLSLPPETPFQLVTWVRWAISIGGGIGLMIGLFEARAITREVEAERIRIRQEKLQRERDRLEEFAGVVSHDLRNPLNVAMGRLTLAREEVTDEHLDVAAKSLERMSSLIEDLLTLAREGRSVTDWESVELDTVVTDCWANVETNGATLVVDVERIVRADENRLQQLFENLVRNAIEHGGPNVTVTVGSLADGFYLEDDGAGIPEEKRDEIFEVGYSTNHGGTGFGLSIVKQIVEAHDWTLRVTEGTSGGARFEITRVDVAAE